MVSGSSFICLVVFINNFVGKYRLYAFQEKQEIYVLT